MDKMDVEILADGTISIKTSEISSKNHYSADALLEIIEEMSGGQRVSNPSGEARQKKHVHKHIKAGH